MPVGACIDTRHVIPPLTGYERSLVEDLQARARHELAPAARTVRNAADTVLIDRLKAAHPETVARRIVAQRFEGNLLPDIELDLDHLGIVLVRDVLMDPEKYEGETLCDPFEGAEYGRCKAKIMHSRHGDGLIIHSFAHGSTVYRLRHDLASATTLLGAKATKATALDLMCEIDAAANFDAGETVQLIAEASRVSKFGVRVVGSRLKADRNARAKARQKAAAAARAAADMSNRLRRRQPPADGRITEVVQEIDQHLAADETEAPPMRNISRNFVEVHTRAPRSLHTLTAATANADGAGNDGEGLLPAPPTPALVVLDPVRTALMVERYFTHIKYDKDGIELYEAALPGAFVRGLMKYPASTVSLVHAINTQPMVAYDGTIITGHGLDRDTGIFHMVEPGLQSCVPTGIVTREEACAAARFLLDEWLIDVLTDTRGKIGALGYAMTLLQRNLLPERPAYNVTAGMRGPGKTTLVNMIHMAVYGRRAAATSWSAHEEELRKVLHSCALSGEPDVVFDNIPSGTVLNSPVVCRATTSETLNDRILGLSEMAAPDAHMILGFTGNLITAGGDQARRTKTVHLMTDLPRPEDRPVAHQDPVGWTLMHRRKILKGLYTLSVFAAQNRPVGQVPSTGMKVWYSLVGWALEVIGSLLDPSVTYDCVAEDKQNEAADPEATPVVTILKLVLAEFGVGAGNKFTARDIASRIDGSHALGLIGHAPLGASAGASVGAGNGAATDRASSLAVGKAFAEAFSMIAKHPRTNMTPLVIGRLLATRVIEQARYLDDTQTISGILKCRPFIGTMQFWLELPAGATPPGGHHTAHHTAGQGEEHPVGDEVIQPTVEPTPSDPHGDMGVGGYPSDRKYPNESETGEYWPRTKNTTGEFSSRPDFSSREGSSPQIATPRTPYPHEGTDPTHLPKAATTDRPGTAVQGTAVQGAAALRDRARTFALTGKSDPIRDLAVQHPDWTPAQLAAALNTNPHRIETALRGWARPGAAAPPSPFNQLNPTPTTSTDQGSDDAS